MPFTHQRWMVTVYFSSSFSPLQHRLFVHHVLKLSTFALIYNIQRISLSIIQELLIPRLKELIYEQMIRSR